MAQNNQPRRKIGFVTIIIIGLLLGLAIKRVALGLIIGIVLGLIASGMVRDKKD